MTKTNKCLISLMIVVLSLVIAIGGASVVQAQTNELVTSVSPVGACPGGTVTVKGTGVPGETITVIIALERVTNWDDGSAPANDDRHEVILGSAMANQDGDWTVTVAIPVTVVRTSDFTQVDTPAGDWMITTQSGINGSRISQGQYVTVLDCGQTVSSNTTATATSMPRTGFPVGIAGVLGGLMTSAGIGIRMIRRGR